MHDRRPDFQRVLRPQAYCVRCDKIGESRQSWKNGRTVGKYRTQYVFVCNTCGGLVEPGYLPASVAIDWSIPGQLIGERVAEKTRARVAAGIARYWAPLAVPVEGRDGKEAATLELPLRTQTTRAETALAMLPFMLERRGEYRDRALSEPLSVLTANDTTKALISHAMLPFIAELRGGSSDARPVSEPAATFTASGNHHALVTSYYSASDDSAPVTFPMGTLTTHERHALVMRNNTGGAEMVTPVSEYLRTLTTAAHQSLIHGPVRGSKPPVTVESLREAEAVVSECYMRMFQPHESAAGQAFPHDYQWDVPDEKGRMPSKRDKARLTGNAVAPPCARDLMHVVVDTLTGAAA